MREALTAAWYEVTFWCHDSEWILEQEYTGVKPTSCNTRRQVDGIRQRPIYRSDSEQQG